MDFPALIRLFGEFQAQSRGSNPQLQPSNQRVYGTIRHPNGQPGVGLIVVANDRDIRAVEPLGEAIADEKGSYAISYELDTTSREEKKSVNLLMQVFRGDQLLFQSPINQLRYNASTECQIDITLEEGDTYVESEYSRLDRVIESVVGELAIDDLQENGENQDITFLSGKLGEDVNKLRCYSLARRSSSAFQIPPEFFYALFAEHSLLGAKLIDKTLTNGSNIGLDSDIRALFYDVVLSPPENIASAIDRAFRDELIPEISKGMLHTILTTLKQHENDAKRHDKATSDPIKGDTDFILGQARRFLKLDAAQGEAALAKLTREEWIEIIASSEKNTQASTVKSETVKIRASRMLGYMEVQHPTATFIANMERDPSFLPETRKALLVAFSKPGFSLTATKMNHLFSSSKGTKFADRTPEEVQSQQTVKQAAEGLQRVFRLTPAYQSTKALINAGMGSSAKIHARGKEGFIQDCAGRGIFQKTEAESIFRRATDIHLASCFMAGEIQAITAATRVQALSNQLEPRLVDSVSQDYPNMKSLFQLGDFCACEDCRTVHSAAAYVVDILQFLKNRRVVDRTAETSKNAKDVLFSRRPDLGDMDLSCANTNIPLPYIDLVCELLEEAVSPDPGISFQGDLAQGPISTPLLEKLKQAGLPFTPAATISDQYNSLDERVVRDKTVVCKLTPVGNATPRRYNVRTLKQTYGSSEEVASVPQHVNSAAYDVLKGSQYAFGLPFDLAHEETRAYFAQFGIPRGDLMRALTNEYVPPDYDIVDEDLGLSEMKSRLITNPDEHGQAKYWNSGTKPAATLMSNVLTFIDRAVITYTDLLTLLTLPWLNPQGILSIKNLDDSCDLNKKEIAGLNDASLDLLHRFIRLWKLTRIPPTVLDRAIRAPKLGNNSLAKNTLLHIRDMILISAQLNLPLAEVCTFYSTIPDPRYTQIFLNSAANGKIKPAFQLANIVSGTDTSETLSEYASYIALCLGTTESVVGLIIESLGGDLVLLTLENLAAVSSLYMLAQTLNISVGDLLTIKAVCEIDPLSSPSSTLAFLAAVKKIQGANISRSLLLFLLTNTSNDTSIQDLTLDAVLGVLQALQAAYRLVILSNASDFDDHASPTENRQALIGVLSKIKEIDASSLIWFSKMLSGIINNIYDASNTAPDETAKELTMKLSFLSEDAQKNITTAFYPAAAKNASDANKNDFVKTLIDELSAWLIKQSKVRALNLELRSYFQLSEDVVTEILQHARLRQPASAGEMLLAEILTDDALNPKDESLPSINVVEFTTQIWAIRLLSVMARYLPSLELSAGQIGWLLENSSTFGWFKLDDLAYRLDPSDKAPGYQIDPISYTSWASFQDLLNILKSYVSIQNPTDPNEPFTVFGLFELTKRSTSVTMQTFADYLAQLTGLESRSLQDLSGHFGFKLDAESTPFWRPESYLRLQRAATILRRLGLDFKTALNLCLTLNMADSLVMRQALKAQYADADWLGVLKMVQDPVRGKKRDALIAFLMADHPNFQTSESLYRHYLIDVEMGTCMATSRIVEAHATIQLFVQRCLLGLETDIMADLIHDSGWSQWEWMAKYRVWEANRKVFLWPENWIDPSLRLDKSEIYRSFENELSGKQLSDDAVESSVQSYLEDLEDIAQLDVMACYYDFAALNTHVFARTRGGDPQIYYHRLFIQEREWTPWVKVDLDINGPQLVPFIRNGCLCLAWPVFTEESDPSQMNDPVTIPILENIVSTADKTDQLRKRWKIQLAVSEWTNGKWKAKKLSEGALYYPPSFSSKEPSPVSKESINFYNFTQDSPGSPNSILPSTGSEHIISGMIHKPDKKDDYYIGSFKFTGIRHDPEPLNDPSYRPWTSSPSVPDATRENGRFISPSGKSQLNFLLAIRQNQTVASVFKGPLSPYVVTAALQKYQPEYYRAPTSDPLFYYIHMPAFYRDSSRSLVITPGRFGYTLVNDTRVETAVTMSVYYPWTEQLLAVREKYPDDEEGLRKDPEFQRLTSIWDGTYWLGKVKVSNFDHKLVALLRSAINTGGVASLMKRNTQLQLSQEFEQAYPPHDEVLKPYPVEDLDFSREGAYSNYNWELFFHVPFEIAVRLNRDQNFQAAQQWFHYIFNPVGTVESAADPAPQKYWITKPFFLTATTDYISSRIEKILGIVAATGDLATDLRFAISQWRAHPFQPDVIARTRPVAYQLAVVVRYIKNLIDWGDAFFREYTRESITQATQYYSLADKLLGPKPRNVPPAKKPAIQTYNQLEWHIDLFGNALVDLENYVPDIGEPSSGETAPSPITGLYFCVPQNEELLGYWDLVADRLFKIRHCQDINGIAVPMALFSPPVDPGALVRAVAGGADLSSILAGLNAPLPLYRFTIAIQKAVNLAQLAASFGNSVLDALEKTDTQAMAMLGSMQQSSLAGAIRHAKLKALEEGEGAVTSLTWAKEAIQSRKTYYSSREYMNAWEISATTMSTASLLLSGAVPIVYLLATGLRMLPQFLMGAHGFGGSPAASVTIGGDQAGGAAEISAKSMEAAAAGFEKIAAMTRAQGDFQRRMDEWKFSERQADAELTKCDQDIVNAKLHVAMLQADIDQQDLAVSQSHDMDAFMRSKFTNQELYQWMISVTSKRYFDAYQLAFNVAKQAERALQFELGTDRTFLTFGWDSLKKGLHAADELVFSLRTMEVAHNRENSRDYELTKHILLSRLDPVALIKFRETGSCTFQVPEAEFDLDHPGHYMRRHHSVSLSIPFPRVAEPYASVTCKLSLLSNRYRAVKTLGQAAQNAEKQPYAEDSGGDGRFVYDVGAVQSIATSSGQNDAGVFELYFTDERYFPFEYTGAIATWQIELPPTIHQFDYSTITDVVLHLRYTAREGGTTLRNAVIKEQKALLNNRVLDLGRSGLYQAFILREQFSDRWATLQSSGSATLTLEPHHLLYYVRGHQPRVAEVSWYAAVAPDVHAQAPTSVVLKLDNTNVTLHRDAKASHGLFTGMGGVIKLGSLFRVTMPKEKLVDLCFVVKIVLGG